MESNIKTFPKEELIELAGDYGDPDLFEYIKTEDYGNTRWESHHRLIFKEVTTGNFYAVKYSKGLTESQDSYPFDYEPDDVPCTRVYEKEKTVVVKYYEENP